MTIQEIVRPTNYKKNYLPGSNFPLHTRVSSNNNHKLKELFDKCSLHFRGLRCVRFDILCSNYE